MTWRQRDDLYRQVAFVFPDMTPFEFHYTVRTATIEHKPTGSAFKVLEELNTAMAPFVVRWQVKDGPSSGSVGSVGRWGDVRQALSYWADEVRYVAEEPDLWAELQRISAGLQPVEDVPDTPFTPEEQAEIAERLDQVNEQVSATPGFSPSS